MVGQEQGSGARALQRLAPDLISAGAPGAGVSAGLATKLSIRSIGKSYGPVLALADASLDLTEGEFLTLLGPSGSGKTTLLMIVAGLIQPTAGEVWIGGKLSTYEPPNKRDIGMVFQNYALFPHLTIEENIAFPLKMRRMPAAQAAEEVRRVLDIVQLPHVAGRLPKELSGGQQQRIALARCMVYRPSIILMDEPLGALDRKLRDRMQLEIKQLHKRLGITVLYVTHDQEEALAMSDRICLMKAGRIEQIGSPEELYFRPRTEFAADFLGESNIIAGRVVASGADGVVEGPGGLRVRAQVDPALAPGRTVKAVIRPESLRILQPGEIAENVAEGVLAESLFIGGVCRHYVSIADDLVLSLKQLTDGGAAVPPPGTRIRVGWRGDHTLVLGVA
jgi:putative spermidine/putrescine transport system ATP-binding protein